MKRDRVIKTLCLGIAHFIDKNGYQAQVYKKHGERIRYLVTDVTGQTEHFRLKYDADVKIVPENKLGRLWHTVAALLTYRPHNVELYLTGYMALPYALLAKITGRNLIVILRGLEFKSHRTTWYYALVLKMSDMIIAKEFYLNEGAIGLKLGHKTHMLHNCVPCVSEVVPPYADRNIDLLFLNTPRRMRHVLFLVDVIAKLLERNPGMKVTIAGFGVLDEKYNSIELDYQREVLHKIEALGLKDKIELKGFVRNAPEMMSASKVFILPADVIYCNYALLEAMSCGCVPVVADGEGARLVVEDGVGGFIRPLSVSAFVDAVESALQPEMWERCSGNARRKIDEEYSIESWYAGICNIRNLI
jgi:hypothetical protein